MHRAFLNLGILLSCFASAGCGDISRPNHEAVDAQPQSTADGSVATAADARSADASTADASAADAGTADADPSPDAVPPDALPPQTFYWADWTAAEPGAPGAAVATFEPPSGSISVSYNGEIQFAQTEPGTNYWVPGGPYINEVTANAPAHSDIIALVGGTEATNTLVFDPPVTGLVMGLVSLGAPSANVKYEFDSAITLLSFGAGYWGNGTIAVDSDTIVSGSEGHGAIQFVGTISKLSWTVTNSENWHGFTIGIPNQ